jgi:hypothetical protein
VGADTDAGAVISLCGFDGFLSGCSVGTLLQGNPEDGDGYGQSLTPGNFDGNEFFDLAVGAPLETVAGRAGAGAVDARDGSSPFGLPAAADEPLYFQGNDGVPGTGRGWRPVRSRAVRLTAAAARPAQLANARAAAATRWGSSVRRWPRARSISRS